MTIDRCRPRRLTPSATDGPLDVEVVCDELGGVVIVVRGELDKGGRTVACLLAGCLREVLDVGGSGRTVVLNLAGVDFVDVGGMRLLTEATGWAKARDVRLRLAGCRASLRRLLQLSGVIDGVDMIPFEPT